MGIDLSVIWFVIIVFAGSVFCFPLFATVKTVT